MSFLGHFAENVPALQPMHRWVRALRVTVRETDARLNGAPMPGFMIGEEIVTGADSVAAPSSGVADAEYLAFEDVFYDAAVVDSKMARYVPYLKEAADALPGLPVLDLGCGRGEMLRNLAGAGVPCSGVEINTVEYEHLRDEGFDVSNTDALTYLLTLPDASLAGVTILHVIEHLEPEYLLRLINAMGAKIRPGGLAIVETPNPKCVSVHGNFYLDVSHVRPYPIETIGFYLGRARFRSLRNAFLMPCPIAYRVPDMPEANYTDYAIFASR
jgi:O-antigen chain-terminating methyltransferase